MSTTERTYPITGSKDTKGQIALVYNPDHSLHHVHERGYVESPLRVETIRKALQKTDFFQPISPHSFPEKHIAAVHDRKFFTYLKKMCESLSGDDSLYPYTFPLHNPDRPPRDLQYCAGYYCIDTFTPINRKALKAAKDAVDCALTAAKALVDGSHRAYALVRPPGHHTERGFFGGFCYLNSTAIAAQYLSCHGPVSILDIDYHHGNGQQNIFYERDDVLTVSLHGHPSIAYPYFSGFSEEKGSGKGEGFNLNLPLPEKITPGTYIKTLMAARRMIEQFKPVFLVVALGFDTAREDPTGSWPLEAADFRNIGEIIGALSCPILLVQEGGYRIATIGRNARAFFEGLRNTSFVLP